MKLIKKRERTKKYTHNRCSNKETIILAASEEEEGGCQKQVSNASKGPDASPKKRGGENHESQENLGKKKKTRGEEGWKKAYRGELPRREGAESIKKGRRGKRWRKAERGAGPLFGFKGEHLALRGTVRRPQKKVRF